MARIDKKQAVKEMTGLASVDPKGMALNQGGDNIQAQIQSTQGEPISPAALKEGEFVFSIPAIIAIGDGDYNHGLEVITALHDRLKTAGEQMLQEHSLANAPQG